MNWTYLKQHKTICSYSNLLFNIPKKKKKKKRGSHSSGCCSAGRLSAEPSLIISFDSWIAKRKQQESISQQIRLFCFLLLSMVTSYIDIITHNFRTDRQVSVSAHVPESRFSGNSEMKKLWKNANFSSESVTRAAVCEANLHRDRFSSTRPEFLSVLILHSYSW